MVGSMVGTVTRSILDLVFGVKGSMIRGEYILVSDVMLEFEINRFSVEMFGPSFLVPLLCPPVLARRVTRPLQFYHVWR